MGVDRVSASPRVQLPESFFMKPPWPYCIGFLMVVDRVYASPRSQLPNTFYKFWRHHQHHHKDSTAATYTMFSVQVYHKATYPRCRARCVTTNGMVCLHRGNSSLLFPPLWSWELWFIVGPPIQPINGGIQSTWGPPQDAPNVYQL